MARSLRIALALPERAPTGSGNRVSAERWSEFLSEAGHTVYLLESAQDVLALADLDVWVGLHAERSAASLDLARQHSPKVASVTVLTGTDLYRAGGPSPAALAQMERSDLLVVLSPGALEELPPAWRERARCLVQVPEGLAPRSMPQGRPTLAMLGHLRAVKDPGVVLAALEHLKPDLELRIVHAGEPLDESLLARCRAVDASDSRYSYVGALARQDALATLEAASGLLLPSRSEGGANVLSEALLIGRAVIASDVSGNTSFLPAGYPGLFESGNARALSVLLARFATDSAWRSELTALCVTAGHQLRRFDERAAWVTLIEELARESDA